MRCCLGQFDGVAQDAREINLQGAAVGAHDFDLRRCTRDVVAQFLYPDELPVVPTFTLDGREHLQGIRVDLPDLRGYAALMGGMH